MHFTRFLKNVLFILLLSVATTANSFSQDNLLSVATASLTAGLTNSIDAKLGLNGNDLTLAQHIQKGIVDSAINSGVNTALNGGDFGENFLNSFKNITTTNLATELTTAIGNLELSSGGKIREGGLVKVISHASIGCAAQSLAGGSCSAGALGAATAELLAPHLTQNELTKMQSEFTVLIGTGITALLAGEDLDSAITAGIQVERFNRQLHYKEVEWIKDNAKEFADKEGISEFEAIERLGQQALRKVDLLWRTILSDGDDIAALDYLAGAASEGTFVNGLGETQHLFTTSNGQLLRPEMFAQFANRPFYEKYIHTGITRNLNAGLTKEPKDIGVDLKEGVINGASRLKEAIREDPAAVAKAFYEGVWNVIKSTPEAIVDGVESTGDAIGEGIAALSMDEMLSELYGTDVSDIQKSMLTLRVFASLTGAKLAGEVVDQGSEVLSDVAKASTEILRKKIDELIPENAGAKPLPDHLLADADFAGRIPARQDLAEHLIEAKLSGKQINGGHNMTSFEATLNGKGEILSKIKVSPGIYHIKYKITGKNYGQKEYPQKTVYDPNAFTDDAMINMAQHASAKAAIQHQLGFSKDKGNGAFEIGVTVDNVLFNSIIRDGKVVTTYAEK